MINYNTIVVFDFETGGLDTATLEPLSLAAIALDPRSLREKDRFHSLMRPLDEKNVDPRALAVNGLDLAVLRGAPEQRFVWEAFARFVRKHNRKGTPFTAPIPAGKNIWKFDLPIADRLCRTYGMVDKAGVPNLFNQRQLIDLEHSLFWWFESSDELKDHKMDTCRPYFGLETEGAHDAVVDAEQTAELIVKFLKLHRTLKAKKKEDGTPWIQFEGSCRSA